MNPCHPHQSKHSQGNFDHFLNNQTFTKICPIVNLIIIVFYIQKNPAVVMLQAVVLVTQQHGWVNQVQMPTKVDIYYQKQVLIFFIVKFFLFVSTIPSKSNILVWSIALNVRSKLLKSLEFSSILIICLSLYI